MRNASTNRRHDAASIRQWSTDRGKSIATLPRIEIVATHSFKRRKHFLIATRMGIFPPRESPAQFQSGVVLLSSFQPLACNFQIASSPVFKTCKCYNLRYNLARKSFKTKDRPPKPSPLFRGPLGAGLHAMERRAGGARQQRQRDAALKTAALHSNLEVKCCGIGLHGMRGSRKMQGRWLRRLRWWGARFRTTA
jgi:hypothetical protein